MSDIRPLVLARQHKTHLQSCEITSSDYLAQQMRMDSSKGLSFEEQTVRVTSGLPCEGVISQAFKLDSRTTYGGIVIGAGDVGVH